MVANLRKPITKAADLDQRLGRACVRKCPECRAMKGNEALGEEKWQRIPDKRKTVFLRSCNRQEESMTKE